MITVLLIHSRFIESQRIIFLKHIKLKLSALVCKNSEDHRLQLYPERFSILVKNIFFKNDF